MLRLLLILLTMLLAASAHGKPVSPYLGGYDGAKPGFAPVYRSGADTWPDTWAAIATDCIRAYSADSIIRGGVGSYDVILDSSPNAGNGLQTNESYKVTVSSDEKGAMWLGGGQKCFVAQRPALTSYAVTVVFKWAQDAYYSTLVNLETAAPWSEPTRHALGFGYNSSYGLGWLGASSFPLGSRSGIATSPWHVMTLVFVPSASAALFIDGNLKTAWTSGIDDGSGFAAPAADALSVGGVFSGGAQNHNYIRCILLYVPIAGRREAIEAELMRKYL